MTHIRRWQPFSSEGSLTGFPFSAWFDFNPGIAHRPASRALGVDVIRNDEGYVVQASLPGVSPDDIDVTIDGNLLKIRATAGEEETKSDSSYIHPARAETRIILPVVATASGHRHRKR